MLPPSPAAESTNRLLTTLPRAEYARLATGFEPVKLASGEVLHQPGEPIRHVYFPDDCLVSLLAVASSRAMLEVGLVGNEGMVGIPLALGVGIAPIRALVQESGTAMRMKSSRFGREFGRNPSLHRVLLRYANTLMVQASQTAVCSRFHLLEARLARLLLMTRDRMQADVFHLTHEFLAQMLGVRRVGVTQAAGSLQRRSLIAYSRGEISILHGGGLEAAACQCYRVVRNAPDRPSGDRGDHGEPARRNGATVQR